MFVNKFFLKSLFASLALASCALGGVGDLALAQGTPGLVIFGDRDLEPLNYRLDRGGDAKERDRYRLRIPKKKLENGAIQFVISYPDYFDGKFDLAKDEDSNTYKNIEVRPNGKKDEALELKNVIWDEENRFLQIDLAQPLTKPQKLEIVLSNTKNPEMGTYYLRAQVVPAIKAPVPELIGAWILTINP